MNPFSMPPSTKNWSSTSNSVSTSALPIPYTSYFFMLFSSGSNECGEGTLCSVEGELNLLVAVRCGNEPRFEGGRRQVYPVVQHGMEIPAKVLHITAHDLSNGGYRRLFVEEATEHPSDLIGGKRNSGSIGAVFQACYQSARATVEIGMEAGLLDFLQHGQTRSYSKRTAREGSCLIYRTGRSDMLHDFLTPAERTHG